MDVKIIQVAYEDGTVTIARAAMSLTFPTRFMLAAAMNPCPRGSFGVTMSLAKTSQEHESHPCNMLRDPSLC